MASIVDIIIRTRKEGDAEKSTEDGLLKLGKTVATAAAAITAFGIVAKKAFDLAQEGAVVAQTAESFDLLLSKVGAAPDLLNQLDEAAGGTISQMGLMSSTATLLAGASGDLATQLADSTPRLLEIARAANKLNPSLGDTTFLYNSLATGIKRASPLILDNLGLTIKVGEANAAYAAALGKTVEQLTAEEQKQALLNETLRAGGVLIDQVGGSLDSATDAYTRFEAATADATDSLKSGFARVFTPIIETLNSGVDLWDVTTSAVDMFGASITKIPGVLRLASGELVTTLELIRMYNGTMLMAEQAHDGWMSALEGAAEAASVTTEAHDDLGISMEDVQKAITGKLGDAWEEYESIVRRIGEPLDDFIGRQEDAKGAIADTTRELIFQIASADLSAEAALALAREMGFLSEADYAVIQATNLVKDAFEDADGAIPTENIEGFTGAIDTLTERLDPAIVGLDEAARLLKILEETDNISIVVDLVTRGFSTGYISNIEAAGGYYDPRLGTYVPAGNRRAHGGSTSAGSPYMVGEHGPELFVPSSDGSVVSNANMRAGEDALRSEIRGLRSDLARYQETMPMLMNAAAERAAR